MFAEMLTRSEEKIFLEAIDQYFENELFEDINIKNKENQIEKNIINPDENETEFQIDKEKETNIEIMNIKFYEALNINNNEIKDISTDFESEDNSLNPEKVIIKISDCLILSKESIEQNKLKVLKEYENQIILEQKIKNLFKKDKIKENININKEINSKENRGM